jgi:8-oxo-dGTP pyrophosphatase MutT (NUDIX family)
VAVIVPDRVDRLRTALGHHPPVDDRERLSLAIVDVELGRLPAPFDEQADLTHVTASAIVVGNRGIVLHRHRRLHRWLQPGGHIEAGESPEEAAVRETVEETGLTVAHFGGRPVLVHVDVHPAARNHVHLDLRYLMVAPDDDPTPPPGESQEVAWFTWTEAERLADDALVGALRTARRLTRASSARGGDQ